MDNIKDLKDKEEIITHVKEIIKSLGYELLSNEYNGSNKKLILKDSKGFIYLSSFASLNSKKKPRKFGASNPYTIQNIEKWLKLNNKSIEVVSKIYTNKSEKLEWKCLICRNNFFMNWDSMSQLKGRFVQHGTQVDLPCFCSNRKLTIEYIREFVKDIGYELVSEEYINNNSNLILKDNYGYLYNPTYHELQEGNNLYMVSKSNPYSIENIKLYLKLNNPKYELITDIYSSADSELLLKDSYGYFYTTKWSLIQSGRLPTFVTKTNRFSIDNIKLWIISNNKPFELISKEYVGSKELLQWRCLKKDCNEDFQSTWSDISQGHGCGFCHGLKAGLSNCLTTINREVASEWHPTLNGDLTPYDFTIYSNTYAWWKCNECGHEWCASIGNRNYNENGCPVCALKNKSGENHHNWKGGITPVNKQIRQSDSYKQWREAIFKRDNYTCKCCGDKTGHNLVAHHIENFATNENLRFNSNNGITLCNKCHNPNKYGSFHHIYGCINNTKEQLEEYIKITQNNKS